MTDNKLRAAHPVYPEGPPCNPNCPGEHSMYHDGYADGYENGERAALAASATDEGPDMDTAPLRDAAERITAWADRLDNAALARPAVPETLDVDR